MQYCPVRVKTFVAHYAYTNVNNTFRINECLLQ